ncbi:MAG: UDP-3-O-(3-hydroxymyristoyl)glucosamine N-acyltransferase [Planctomycetes bacterium RBG_16_55_9]|nr:MAG: UDP-3-O-(3-hydroxymyristoyl)glucosamine N-acyltransferase [Planctomycetes bacterium RBG_16_55_9]
MEVTIRQLAERLGAELVGRAGDGDKPITAVRPIEAAGETDVTFVTSDKHRAALALSCAGAILVSTPLEAFSKPQLIVKNVNAALIEALNVFAPKLKGPVEGIDPTARLGQRVTIAECVCVGPGVVIDDGVRIGRRSVIGSGCKIGENSTIGENCRLDGNVVVYHNCCIGNHVVVQANATIGSTGFGYSLIDGAHRLVPHNGGVVIEDFVEIGANTCIDRAKFGNTIIGAGTKIDNLVQIAHNVVIGKCCLIAAQAGVSGSCTLGDGVVMAGQVGLADNIRIGDGTMVGAQSGVMSNVPAGQKMLWTPALKKEEALRVMALMVRLPKLAEQIKQLGKRIEKLEATEDDKE